MTKQRKREHVENYLKTCYMGETLFEDVILDHNALPDMDFDEIDTSVEIFGKKLQIPLIINSMTGGADISEGLNRDLSILAKKFGLGIAVGSQNIALCNPETKKSFCVVREIMEDGLVLGNLNAAMPIEKVLKASDLIQADAMQLHLNPAQELSMEEGDRSFRGVLDNIEGVQKVYKKSLMIKEVGFGINKPTALKLYERGIRWIDISGCGGTNFMEIEDMRNHRMDFEELYVWGNPTAETLIRVRELPKDLHIMASGGIKNALDIVKALVMGAEVVGISGEILNFLVRGGYEYTEKYVESLLYKVKMIMLLLGKKNTHELNQVPYRVKGSLLERLEAKQYRE